MLTLESLLKKYKFLPYGKNALLKRGKIVDDIPEYCTIDGTKAYLKLTSLLYDIGKLLDIDVNYIVYRLDDIVAHDNY